MRSVASVIPRNVASGAFWGPYQPLSLSLPPFFLYTHETPLSSNTSVAIHSRGAFVCCCCWSLVKKLYIQCGVKTEFNPRKAARLCRGLS